METRAEYLPVGYGVLEPGLQAAIDLLERERANELNIAHHARMHAEFEEAKKHEAVADSYLKSIELLKEQREWLRGECPELYGDGSVRCS